MIKIFIQLSLFCSPQYYKQMIKWSNLHNQQIKKQHHIKISTHKVRMVSSSHITGLYHPSFLGVNKSLAIKNYIQNDTNYGWKTEIVAFRYTCSVQKISKYTF